MNGALVKRSMRIAGHRTSLALETEFWAALEAIAGERHISLPALIAEIDKARAAAAPDATLASAARVHAIAAPVRERPIRDSKLK